MTTETNSVLDSVKDAFAPVTDALKNLQNWKFRKPPASSSRRPPTPPRTAPPTFTPVRRR